MRIFIFSPAFQDHLGTPSKNLGDIIIRYAVDAAVKKLFPDAAITYASSHQPLDEKLLEEADKADLKLVAGSNLLSSHIRTYNQWKLYQTEERYLNPAKIHAVLCGVGWWQYQKQPDSVTSAFYQKVLHPKIIHSVRDSYTAAQLQSAGIKNVINTSCPTMWNLDGKETSRQANNQQCILCLTDYKRDIENDNMLISILMKYYEKVLFFPQGSQDLEYINQIPLFIKYRERFTIYSHDIQEILRLATMGDVDYVGTRLHAGAWCLQKNIPSLILAVDNRSQEIARDINLPVVGRADQKAICSWLSGEKLFPNISLPTKAIARWKKNLLEAFS